MKKLLVIGILLVMVAMIFIAILPSVSAKTILDETTKLEERDAYKVWSGGAIAWTVEIESTEPIDIRMMNEDNYNHWLKHESYKSYTAASVDDCTSKTYTVNLPEGEWYITLDNEDNEYISDVSIKVTAKDIEKSNGNGDTPGFEGITFVVGISIVVAIIMINKKQKVRG